MTTTKIMGIALAILAAGSLGSAAAQAQDYKIGYITDLDVYKRQR